jgi:hypothetical protein
MVDLYLKNADKRFTINKDPQANLDYTWDWSEYLTPLADTIATQQITVDDGLVLNSSQIVGGNKVVAYISGGTLGELQKAVCRITTTAGRTDERTMYFNILNR